MANTQKAYFALLVTLCELTALLSMLTVVVHARRRPERRGDQV